MLIKENILPLLDDFQRVVSFIPEITDSGKVMFFDIETTGFSPVSSYLYLIGCMYIKDSDVVLTQLFSEGPDDEAELLKEFCELTCSFDTLVHFNGQTFDIPYIAKKLASYAMPDSISSKGSFDIYKVLRPFKALFGLSNLHQKSFEPVADFHRKDTFNGGELIEVYNRYLAMVRLEELRNLRKGAAYNPTAASGLALAGNVSSTDLLKSLLLHNYEDVFGMLKIGVLLEIPAFLRGKGEPVSCSAGDTDDEPVSCSIDGNSVTLTFSLTSPVCAKYFAGFSSQHFSVTIRGCLLTIKLPVFEGELKLFFKNYKDYYYVPARDEAIHHSLGDFMDKHEIKKATASTCYTKHTDRYVPYVADGCGCKCAVFRSDYKSKMNYITVNDFKKLEKSSLAGYAASLLTAADQAPLPCG